MQQLTSDRQEANWIPVTNNTLNGTDHTIGWLVGWLGFNGTFNTE